MCCDLAGSVGSQKHWLWDIARKRNKFLLFSIVLRILVAHNLGITGPIQVGFSAKCTSPNEDFNQIKKLKMSHVLLPTDFPRSIASHIACFWRRFPKSYMSILKVGQLGAFDMPHKRWHNKSSTDVSLTLTCEVYNIAHTSITMACRELIWVEVGVAEYMFRLTSGYLCIHVVTQPWVHYWTSSNFSAE